MHVGWVLSTSRSLPWQPTEVLYCFLSVQLHIKIMICLFLCNFSLYQSRCMHVHTKHLQKANVPNLFIILCSSLFVYVITTTLFFIPLKNPLLSGSLHFFPYHYPTPSQEGRKSLPLLRKNVKAEFLSKVTSATLSLNLFQTSFIATYFHVTHAAISC